MEPLALHTAVIIPIRIKVSRIFFAAFTPCQEKISICFQVFFFIRPYVKNSTSPRIIAYIMEIPVNTHTKRTAANIPNNNNSIIRLRGYYTADIFLFLSCFFFTLIYFDIKKQKLCTVLHSTIASVF